MPFIVSTAGGTETGVVRHTIANRVGDIVTAAIAYDSGPRVHPLPILRLRVCKVLLQKVIRAVACLAGDVAGETRVEIVF